MYGHTQGKDKARPRRAPQLPQKRSVAGRAFWQFGQVLVAAASGVGSVLAGSSLLTAFLKSRMLSPIALPNIGNLPGPKITSTITTMTMRCHGCKTLTPMFAVFSRARL